MPKVFFVGLLTSQLALLRFEFKKREKKKKKKPVTNSRKGTKIMYIASVLIIFKKIYTGNIC